MKKWISVILITVLTLTLAACSGGSGGDDGGEEDGQNPAMNFVGNYVCDRASIYIGAEGDDGIFAVVTWGSSYSESTSWEMSGTFDSEKLQFEYSDCTRTNYVYNEEGEAESLEEVYTGGHGAIVFQDGDPLTLIWQDDQENIAEGMVFQYAGVAPGEGMPEADIPNPWSTADSLEAAVEGAGIDMFSVPSELTLSIGEPAPYEYRYMDGVVEVYVKYPAVDLLIRKGKAEVAEDGDISGDYNGYEYTWEQNIKGLVVNCFGNREGEATKTIWQSDDYCYAILASGMGGDTDFGLSPDDLNSIINGIQ